MKKVTPIHIPKTGGATLWRELGYTKPIGHRTLRDLDISEVSQTYIFGFLRCPLDRAVSNYYFIKQSPDISFDQGIKRRGLKTLHLLMPHLGDINYFWQSIDPAIFGPVYIMRHQIFWLSNSPLKQKFNAYDFSKYSEELDRFFKASGHKRIPQIKMVHKTIHREVNEELSAKTVNKLKDIYEDDFRLLDEFNIPHLG